MKLLLKSCAYYAGILNVFWIYLQKRRIRGDVAECLFLNCKPHNRVLAIRDFFFYFPLPSYSISYIISKIYVFGLMKKKKEKRKKNRSTPFEVSSGFEDCIYICSVIISLSKWSSGATRHFNIIDRDFNFSRTTAHCTMNIMQRRKFRSNDISFFFFCRLLTRIGFKKEKNDLFW